jgi:flagellar basal-body rod modification protein FlgD
MNPTAHATTPTGTTAATTAAAATGTAGAGSSLPINQNQFLQLLMAELKNQNPMSPNSSDPMSFVTELAQFTALEQQTNTAQSTSQIATEQGNSAALGLLGHTVTYTDATTGATATGTVQSVDFGSSGATLTINGQTGINPASVSEVS